MSDPQQNSKQISEQVSGRGKSINLQDVHLSLTSDAGEVNILRGISLGVESGEAVGVIGPSGGGKSTMMMVIAGLERASSGTVETAGFDLTNLNEDELALFRRDNVGIVFQDFHLIPTMTALENVAVPLEFAGITDAPERARDRLDAVGLDHRLAHYPGQLSGGEQQRVALARAFAARPAILLADEPTGNLDQHTADAVFNSLLLIVRETGLAALIATHNTALAARMDRILELQDGLVVEQ